MLRYTAQQLLNEPLFREVTGVKVELASRPNPNNAVESKQPDSESNEPPSDTVTLRLVVEDNKKLKQKHKDDEAVEFDFDLTKDIPVDVAKDMVSFMIRFSRFVKEFPLHSLKRPVEQAHRKGTMQVPSKGDHARVSSADAIVVPYGGKVTFACRPKFEWPILPCICDGLAFDTPHLVVADRHVVNVPHFKREFTPFFVRDTPGDYFACVALWLYLLPFVTWLSFEGKTSANNTMPASSRWISSTDFACSTLEIILFSKPNKTFCAFSDHN